MSDIASLGLAVDSRQVTSANAALDQLAVKSAAAGAGVDKLAASGAKSETVMRAIESAAKRQGISTAEMTTRVNAASASHAKLSAAAGTAAVGIGQLANAAAGTGGGSSGGGSLSSAADKSSTALERLGNTLTRRVLFAFAAKEVRDLAVYVWGLNSAIAATADSAQRSGVGGGAFQGLQTAAAYKGVSNNDFNGAMVAFNVQVDLAKRGLGDLKTLLSSNGKTVGDTATTFGVVADMVKNASSEAAKFSILQQAGLPTSAAFVKYMEQGSAAIKAQADAAGKLSQKQQDEIVKIDAAWQQGWTNFENWGKRAIVNVFEAASNLKNYNPFGPDVFSEKPGQKLTGSRTEAYGAGSQGSVTRGTDLAAPGPTKPTFDPNIAKQQIGLEQQRLSLLSPLAQAEDVVAQKSNEIRLAALGNVNISKDQAAALKLVTLAQFEMNRVGQQAAIGTFNLTAAQKAAGDQLRAWVAQKLLDPNNPTQYAAALSVLQKQMEQTAQTALVAAAPLEGLQRLANEAGSVRTQLDQFAVTSTNAVTPALRDMLLGTTSLSAGFKSLGMTIVNALTDAIIKLTIIKPLLASLGLSGSGGGLLSLLGIDGGATSGASSLGGASAVSAGGAGSTFASAFGAHSGMGPGDAPTFTRSVPTSTFHNAPRFHTGIGPGEQAAIIRTDESVLTPGQMKQLAPKGSDPQSVHVTVGVSVDNDGNLQAYVKDVSQKSASASISGFVTSPAFVDHVGAALPKTASRRLGR